MKVTELRQNMTFSSIQMKNGEQTDEQFVKV